MLPWGTCDSKVPKEPFQLRRDDNAGTKAGKSHAGGALHAKEELGWGGGEHRDWCRGEGRGDRERECLPGA